MSVAGNGGPALAAIDDNPRQAASMASSSKVTVEYHDPSGVFSLVQEDLIARLPLRNLHWKAPTRPLRSIDSLHVDLVPSKESAYLSGVANAGLAPPQGTSATPMRTTEEILRPPVKEKQRRHQIPGLRQTPYLKIFLLRCDDSDTYKSTARKQVREWVKEHTPPAQSSSTTTQENHDAYEWMILHVVVPDTPAASQPLGSSSSTTGDKEKGTSTSRWARGTTTLLEKLRADFNISSKSAPDRVAQIRLQKERVPPHMLPAPATVTSPPIAESLQDQDRAWSDVITKFKTLILLSFDLRVSQYEDDIKKNDAQRSFPGWNFNTFFILKEGLARGFESVGLVEDALVGYDELSIGLDTVIRDQAKDDTQGGVILSHSEDLYEKASEILRQSQKDGIDQKSEHAQLHDEQLISAQRKDYRDLILANNISAFDFRSYIFARQMALLLRLGNSQSTRADLAAKLNLRLGASGQQRSADDSSVGLRTGDQISTAEDLYSLAELCSRALNFITFGARLLRDDLLNGARTHATFLPDALVDNMVRSWTFAALEQTLQATATSLLPFTRYPKDNATSTSEKSLSFGGQSKEQKLRVSEPKSMMHPSRSSSLNQGRVPVEPPYAQPTTTGQVVFENGQYNDRPAPTQDSALPQAKNGLQELAGTRAQLVVVQRRVLEQMGKTLDWNIGWTAVLPSIIRHDELSDIDIESDEQIKQEAEPARPSKTTKLDTPTAGILAGALAHAVSTLEQFRQSYEALSDLIVKHYMAAGQNKSAESVLGDLAALRFELGDFAAAAMYFGRMASLFAESRWNTAETTMLMMHSRCLRKLNRKDEYVRTLLDLLAKSAASRMSFAARTDSKDISNMPPDWYNDDKVDTSNVFNELLEFSQQLPYDVTVPMSKYFGDVFVEPYLHHHVGSDGFQLRLQLQHVLEDDITLKVSRLRLTPAESNQGKEIWLESAEPTKLKKGLNHIWLACNINTIGPYVVNKIILESKRIVFVHEPVQKSELTTPLGIMTPVSACALKAAKKARILCFPRAEAFDSRIYLSHFIHIDKPRHVEIECTSGWNEITRAVVRLKSASAGLRLRTAKAEVVVGDVSITDKSTPGLLALGTMAANSSITLKIPYDMEVILQDLTIKMEIDYSTDKGTTQYFSAFTIPVDLPLDVNVHDHFKMNALLSKFNIKTANQTPLQLLKVDLQSSEAFHVHAPTRSTEPLYVFAKQPVAITYKITRKAIEGTQSKLSAATSLALLVEYRCLDEDVRDRVSQMFALDAAQSAVHGLARLLVDTLKKQLEHRILPSQFEKIALLDRVDMGRFEDMGWSECLESLPIAMRKETTAWLQKWHESTRIIHLQTGASQAITAPTSPRPPRQMVITVSIPQTHVLHTASLTLTHSPSPEMAVCGQPIQTMLRVSHTRRWASPGPLASATNVLSPNDPMEFIYTVEANPEMWLVAGQRRGQFSAREDAVHEWRILLVPLKPGVTLLPNVDIRPRPQSKAKDSAVEDREGLNCEIDYLSSGETVTVVPNLRSTTLGIGDASQAGGSVVWLEGMGVV
ncbi:TMEM1 family protein-like protein [Ophiobolus disseminans]|uniref:TMEM1 family protein-like protein n=1 Tax=Ophiobolus disseminans TaxID=1469910 RepID=A0A6A7A1I7_9PLEO|nr:TMEM1 family protein-like protein [Ophiobolus disseminans]